MSVAPRGVEVAEWPLPTTSTASRAGSLSSIVSGPSDTTSIRLPAPLLPPTPATSRPPSYRDHASSIASDHTILVPISKPVTISFSKGPKMFRLKFPQIEIRKDVAGSLRSIELSEPTGVQSTMIHAFPGIKQPVPHLEQPVTSGQTPVARVSFLEEQTLQSASTLFQAQPHYSFDTWDDCIHFQEALLDQTVLFTAGVAEAKSKGRGEECISQNLRILRARNGRQVMLVFANSQRKEKKRYISIPLDCIDRIEQSKKPGRPVLLSLRPNFEFLAQLKTLSILFLDDPDQKRFVALLSQAAGVQT